MSELPERASLEYLKKLAKDRLAELRRSDPQAKLASALLAVAREHGFPSWRALKAAVEHRQSDHIARFFEACKTGSTEMVAALLAQNPDLIRAAAPYSRYSGWTGLHEAARQGHADVVRLLVRQGADPNAREQGDHTYPLHWAAACCRNECVRILLDAGADVHGFGDDHALDVIGWACYFRDPGDDVTKWDDRRRELVAFLVDRGARHHIFSAICVGDPDLIRSVAEQDPSAPDRRMSRFEHGKTALHFAIERKRYDILDLLIELGADLEATDGHGHTALESAILEGNQEAANRLRAAGAISPKPAPPRDFKAAMSNLADSIKKGIPMINVPDVAETLDWYSSIGFKELGRAESGGLVNWGMIAFGKSEIMLNMHGKRGRQDTSLWFYTDRIEALYELLKSRQVEAGGIDFIEYLYEPPYGGREFGIRDLNGYNLFFLQT